MREIKKSGERQNYKTSSQRKFSPLPPLDSFCHPLPYNEDRKPDR